MAESGKSVERQKEVGGRVDVKKATVPNGSRSMWLAVALATKAAEVRLGLGTGTGGAHA